MPRSLPLIVSMLSFALGLAVTHSARATLFVQTNLVSDIPGVAAQTDPSLVNPWGLTHTPTSPWWVSDNGTGLSTLYNASGVKQGLVVTIPPSGTGAPTGVVFNSTASSFPLTSGGKATFIFSTENGIIAGWNGGTFAQVAVDMSGAAAVYKGLAIGNASGNDRLYATNFRSGLVEVYDASFGPGPSGGFVDPNLPAGYAPFNIAPINGDLFVTYALQDGAKHDDVPGAGHGYIDEYTTSGSLVRRFASQGALDSPWGLAVAPSTWGSFAGDLLVGNFGDGTINAFNLTTGAFVGPLLDRNSQPLVNQGLWGLAFGSGGSNGDPNTLFFTAGIPGSGQVEDHGLFGTLAPVPTPEPATAGLSLLALAGAGLVACRRRRG